MMTLDRFRSSRRRVEDLSDVTGGEYYDAGGAVVTKAGYVYQEDLVIEIEHDGRLSLQFYRDEELVDGTDENLHMLESKLYQWAIREGYLAG